MPHPERGRECELLRWTCHWNSHSAGVWQHNKSLCVRHHDSTRRLCCLLYTTAETLRSYMMHENVVMNDIRIFILPAVRNARLVSRADVYGKHAHVRVRNIVLPRLQAEPLAAFCPDIRFSNDLYTIPFDQIEQLSRRLVLAYTDPTT